MMAMKECEEVNSGVRDEDEGVRGIGTESKRRE